MIIRQLTQGDEKELRYLHAQYYYPEFSYPDFRKFIATFAVCDDSNHIISAGGIRPIAESIIITDKFRSKRERIEALIKVLGISQEICTQNGLDQLHAFIQDNKWERVLRAYGFNNCKGNALILQV